MGRRCFRRRRRPARPRRGRHHGGGEVAGPRPAIIPFGGSDATGAHGYRLAAGEITQQLARVDHVVCAVGSGGTMAGLVAGLGVARVLGVDAGALTDPRTRVAGLLQAMGESAGDAEGGLRLRTDQVGKVYDSLTPGAAQALVMAARTEGLVLDPVYSGRALAGLVAEVHEGGIAPGQTVIFLVSGGCPDCSEIPRRWRSAGRLSPKPIRTLRRRAGNKSTDETRCAGTASAPERSGGAHRPGPARAPGPYGLDGKRPERAPLDHRPYRAAACPPASTSPGRADLRAGKSA